jgi:hypothetical protein
MDDSNLMGVNLMTGTTAMTATILTAYANKKRVVQQTTMTRAGNRIQDDLESISSLYRGSSIGLAIRRGPRLGRLG